jgi:hypothetical protein
MVMRMTAALAAVFLLVALGVVMIPRWWTLRRYPKAGPAPVGYTVTIEGGRAGTITYREDAGEHAFDWELGGRGPIVSWFWVPQDARWREDVPWAPERRAEIVGRVAAEVLRQKCRTCRYEIGDRMVEFFES